MSKAYMAGPPALYRILRHVPVAFACVAMLLCFSVGNAEPVQPVVVVPKESPDEVLHNPDMGWVLYENYPLDQEPNGSSTLLLLPNENFDVVDTVAVMFSWQDVEREPDQYDFSKVDYAYDYWAKRGKAIQLRMSATTLMWWANRTPPTGAGAPAYVRAKLAENEKQRRELQGVPYDVDDARNPYYRERLAKFLRAVDVHFGPERPVTLIDLRGFGVWGEWHTGFKYATVDERREALKGVIDTWCECLPRHRLALSASYDPDSPAELYAGTTKKYDPAATSHYDEFLRYSAFENALTKPNITFRRDGCGGAVHSNERKLIDMAFERGRGPMFSEFVDGYSQSKAGGAKWVEWKIDDALSLHPNYVCLLGWQGTDTVAFMNERRDLIDSGLRRMGYRFVPTKLTYAPKVAAGETLELTSEWINRGVGRALRDYDLRLALVDKDGRTIESAAKKAATSTWIAGKTFTKLSPLQLKDTAPGTYQIAIGLHDAATARQVVLPLASDRVGGMYVVGTLEVTARDSWGASQ